MRKLEILADAAKYDASCASSGAKKRGRKGQLGNSSGVGICHSYTPDGRCVSLLKILLTNYCVYDCVFCVNRVSSDTPRARFTPEEVIGLTIDFFNDQRWAILTPDASARWDLASLDFGPGVARTEAPRSDELESLWTTYYASIFNPARLKLKAMKAEMPVKHWGTLPEARILPELIRDAPRREREMLRPQRPPAASFFPEPRTLATLADAVERCEACALCEGMGRAVFGEGPIDAALVVVGEQPGDQEERAGRPFVGPAGRVLDAALESAGLDRNRLYLTNAVKHFRHEKGWCPMTVWVP